MELFFKFIIFVAVLFLGIKFLSFRSTIREYQSGVIYRRGKYHRTVGAGSAWVIPLLETIHVVDLRSQVITIPGQEIMTSDRVTIKASVALRYKVNEPEKMLRTALNPNEVIYMDVQLILRQLFASHPVDELMEKRQILDVNLADQMKGKLIDLGLVLESMGIRDIMFPGPFKQAFAQVVEAKQAALASLEKARGETATLRHLANAAKMLENNPALITLKTLQTIGEGKNTVVLGIPGPVLPIHGSEPNPTTQKDKNEPDQKT